MKISTIGLDLAKNWFQVHGVDAEGKVIARRRLRRSEVLTYFQSIEPCLVGMEACATAHRLTGITCRRRLQPIWNEFQARISHQPGRADSGRGGLEHARVSSGRFLGRAISKVVSPIGHP
jgi:hypothetical protein